MGHEGVLSSVIKMLTLFSVVTGWLYVMKDHNGYVFILKSTEPVLDDTLVH